MYASSITAAFSSMYHNIYLNECASNDIVLVWNRCNLVGVE